MLNILIAHFSGEKKFCIPNSICIIVGHVQKRMRLCGHLPKCKIHIFSNKINNFCPHNTKISEYEQNENAIVTQSCKLIGQEYFGIITQNSIFVCLFVFFFFFFFFVASMEAKKST